MEAKIEKKTSINLLQTIGSIYDASKDSKLSSELFKKIKPHLIDLSNYFGLSKKHSFLLAHIFVFNCNGNYSDFNDLAKHFNCNSVKVLTYHKDLIFLEKKGFLKKNKSTRWNAKIVKDEFQIEEVVSSAIINNLPMPKIKPIVYTDILQVLEKIYRLANDRDKDTMATWDIFHFTEEIIESHKKMPFIQKVLQMGLSERDTFFYLYVCWKTIIGNEQTDLSRATDDIFDNGYEKATYVQNIMAKENDLIKNGWMEIQEARFFNDTEVKLSEKSIELLSAEKIILFTKKEKNDSIITPDKIGDKQLFFSGNEQRQLMMLEQTLNNENFLKLQKRLKDKSMPNGVSVLLYGAPGTGKTESVYQFARKTGREIMHVDISKSKSCWFGESEKLIKRIFTDFNEYSKKTKITPILLFNEADAIFSKRKDSSFSNVAQTENAIQNIILEEMEKLNGILFATTNLTCNLDKAFERRFLFKIEFSFPDIAIRSQIWKSKILYMPVEECEILAGKFNFSGGQIDNIVRKCEMFEVLNGITPDISIITEFCNEELISKVNFPSIGFKINNN